MSELKTLEIVTPYGSGANYIELTVQDDYNDTTGYSTLTIIKARMKSSIWDGITTALDGTIAINGTDVASYTGSGWNVVYSDYRYDFAPQSSTSISVPHNADGTLSVTITLKHRAGSSYSAYSTFLWIYQIPTTLQWSIYEMTSAGQTLTLTPQTPRALVRIGNGSTWDTYKVMIGNGSTWEQYRATIGNGTAWVDY